MKWLIFLQLHLFERTGRGVPKIVEVCGKEAYEFRNNSIMVTIPLDAFSTEAADLGINAQVNAQVEGKDAQVEVSIADKILAFCSDAKSLAEICDSLGYKDRRTATKHIKPLVEQGRLAMTVPDKPNSRFQKYITVK